MYYKAKCSYPGFLAAWIIYLQSASAKKDDNPEEALKEFRAIVDQEEEQGDWYAYEIVLSTVIISLMTLYLPLRGFKALKQSTKLLYLTLRRPNDALKTYTQLLTYTKSAVTRNYSEKTINGILDYVGGGKGGAVEVDVLEKFYQATKDALEDAKNEVRDLIRFLIWNGSESNTAPVSQDKLEACKTLAR